MSHSAKILIIEDDISIPILLERWLTSHTSNIVLDHAKTVEDGIARAPEAKCILLDLTIPPKWRPPDTLQLIPELRRHAPVIVLSGYSEGSDEKDAEFAANVIADLGADMVFFKPVIMHSEGVGWLFTAVTAAIGRRLYQAKVDSGKVRV